MGTATEALYESNITSLPLVQKGKVRDIYAVGEEHLLIVTTDRLSAFDVVLPDPIPGKGAILTATSNFWFEKMADIIRNHLSDLSITDVLPDPAEQEQVDGRAIVVKKLKPLPVEAIVRGYIIGSGWSDYKRTGKVCGIDLPAGLSQAEQLPDPIFTPSSKADVGDHDENVDFAYITSLIGEDYANKIKQVSLEIYVRAAAFAKHKGIIIADTKFEFGTDENGEVFLIDEVLTPDSSRFWPQSEYRVGISPPSFDKQFVRDYLETLDWDKRPPGPSLPLEIREKTAAKYREALQRITSPA
ncbi:MAG: phosphoribosylaminoimidazolesuccinocarboxamide synthase [Proteobacteria bacterium]|nr:phosphoribosylaminoimidazolesuccinocarboxamide synthase [Pseudomonadota bacterium]